MEKVPANIRILHVLEALMQDIITGLTIQQVADALHEPYEKVYRDLQILVQYGYVKEENKTFVPSEKFMALGVSFQTQVAKAQEQILIIQQRTMKQAQKLTGAIYGKYDYGNDPY